jgi:hypothetical protein
MPEIIADPPVLPCIDALFLIPLPLLRGNSARPARAQAAPRSSRPGMGALLFVAEMSLIRCGNVAVISLFFAVVPLFFRC